MIGNVKDYILYFSFNNKSNLCPIGENAVIQGISPVSWLIDHVTEVCHVMTQLQLTEQTEAAITDTNKTASALQVMCFYCSILLYVFE